MSDQLLVVLRVCLLVLMYLVFLRVLRAVWVELKGGARVKPTTAPVPAVAGAPAGSGGGGAASVSRARALVAVAPAPLAGAVFALDAETTLGRAAGCRISIDDTHISKVHARVFVHEGSWYVEDLGSTNGTQLNGLPVGSAALLEVGDQVTLGETVLELQ